MESRKLLTIIDYNLWLLWRNILNLLLGKVETLDVPYGPPITLATRYGRMWVRPTERYRKRPRWYKKTGLVRGYLLIDPPEQLHPLRRLCGWMVGDTPDEAVENLHALMDLIEKTDAAQYDKSRRQIKTAAN